MSQWQLRDYTIKEGELDRFLEAWQTGVPPLRHQFGFEVQAWVVPDESRLVWVLRYDGPGSFEDADRRYYDSPERRALEPDPGQWVASKRHAMVRPVAPAAAGVESRA
jgi:hypothetical protein